MTRRARGAPQASPTQPRYEVSGKDLSVLPAHGRLPWVAGAASLPRGVGVGFCAFASPRPSGPCGHLPASHGLNAVCVAYMLGRVSHRSLNIFSWTSRSLVRAQEGTRTWEEGGFRLHQSFDSGVQLHSQTAAVQTYASSSEVRTFS